MTTDADTIRKRVVAAAASLEGTGLLLIPKEPTLEMVERVARVICRHRLLAGDGYGPERLPTEVDTLWRNHIDEAEDVLAALRDYLEAALRALA